MNNTALITGASSGIGKEFAKIHAQEKGDMILVARRVEKLEEIKNELEKEYGVKVMVIASDLAKDGEAQRIYHETKAAGIEIDYLINNAGFGGVGKFHDRPLHEDISMIDLNIKSLTILTRLFLTDFVKRDCGRILNVSSTASLMPGPLQAVYFATKAYVTSFSNAIAEEVCDTKVTVTALLPGATDTEFAAVAGLEGTKLFDKAFGAYSVAKDGYKGMLVGKLNVISGLTVTQKIMMAMVPFIPRKMLLKEVRKFQEKGQ